MIVQELPPRFIHVALWHNGQQFCTVAHDKSMTPVINVAGKHYDAFHGEAVRYMRTFQPENLMFKVHHNTLVVRGFQDQQIATVLAADLSKPRNINTWHRNQRNVNPLAFTYAKALVRHHTHNLYVDYCGNTRENNWSENAVPGMRFGTISSIFDANPDLSVNALRCHAVVVQQVKPENKVTSIHTSEPILDLSISPDKKTIMVLTNETLTMFSTETGEQLKAFHLPNHYNCAWSNDGLTFAILNNNSITVLDNE